MELRELLDGASDMAADVFYEVGEIEPTWIAENVDGLVMVLRTPFTDADISKDIVVRSMRKLFKERNVVRYVFVSEAWIVEFKDHMDAGRPSQHPDRREIIMLRGEDINGDVIGATRYILRPEVGKPKLTELKIDEGEFSGRFTGMFK